MPFPTTSVVDTFERADESPLAGQWATMSGIIANGAILSGNTAMGNGVDSASYLPAQVFASGEASLRFVAPWGAVGAPQVVITFNAQNPAGGGTFNSYFVGWDIAQGGGITIGSFSLGTQQRINNVGQPVAGDFFGGRVYGHTVEGWVYKAATGLWKRYAQKEINPVLGSGPIGLYIHEEISNDAKVDLFAAGQYSIADDQGNDPGGQTNTHFVGRGIA